MVLFICFSDFGEKIIEKASPNRLEYKLSKENVMINLTCSFKKLVYAFTLLSLGDTLLLLTFNTAAAELCWLFNMYARGVVVPNKST